MKFMYPSTAHKFQDPRSTCNAAVSNVQRKISPGIEGNTVTRKIAFRSNYYCVVPGRIMLVFPVFRLRLVDP